MSISCSTLGTSRYLVLYLWKRARLQGVKACAGKCGKFSQSGRVSVVDRYGVRLDLPV